jgi:hypothetical protein
VTLRCALVAAFALLTALPSSAGAVTRTFQTPSHNIVCVYSSSGGPGAFVRCDVLSLNDVGFFLRGDGRPRRRKVSDTAADVTRAPVLRYGSSKRLGLFTCRSRRSGLTCTSGSSGRGFTLSRERQRLF